MQPKTTPITGLAKPVVEKRNPTYSVTTAAMTTTRVDIKGATPAYPPLPTVFYTPEAKVQMDFIVDYCDEEVGWMCYVQEVGNDFLITDVYVPKQEVHATETDISAEALNELAFKLMDEHKDPGQLIGWFHSHVDMAVSPSLQDEHMVEDFLENNPVFIRGIVNKKGASKVDVYYRDFGIAYTCVPTRVFYNMETDPTEGLAELLDKNVTEIDDVYVPFHAEKGQWDNWPKKTYTAPHKGLRSITPDNDLPRAFDTGFGKAWDETTPLKHRPQRWREDDAYWDIGYDFDKEADEKQAFED